MSTTNGHVKALAIQREDAENIVPRSEEAEQAVIGSVLKHPPSFVQIADALTPSDFYVPKYRSMFVAMKALWDANTPIDAVMMHDVGDGFEVWEVTDIDLATPSAAYIDYYAQIIKRHAKLRDVAHLCYQGYLNSLRDNAEPADVVQQVIRTLQGMDSGGTVMFGGEELAQRFMEDLTARRTGTRMLIPTGLANIDHFYGGGFGAGSLNLLMGVTGTGKTELAAQIAFWIAEHIGTTLYATLEMDDIEVLQRIARTEANLDRNVLVSGNLTQEQADAAVEVCARIASSNLWITSPIERYTTDSIRAQALKLRMQSPGGMKFIVVDYVQRLDDIAGTHSSREQDVALMAKNLKSIARELHCPVLALVQPNRDYAGRPDKHPRISDLRESGRLEIEADTIAGMYREDIFWADSTRENQMDLFMLKNRAGIGLPVGASETLMWIVRAAGAGRYEPFLDTSNEPRPNSRQTRRRTRTPQPGRSDPPPQAQEIPFR